MTGLSGCTDLDSQGAWCLPDTPLSRFFLKGCLGKFDDLLEGWRIMDRKVGKDFAVDEDSCGLEALDKAAVGQVFGACGRTKAGDPQSPEGPFAVLAVPCRPCFRLHLGVFGVSEQFRPTAPVSLGGIDHSFAARTAGRRIGCSWHWFCPRRLLPRRGLLRSGCWFGFIGLPTHRLPLCRALRTASRTGPSRLPIRKAGTL